MRPEDVRRRRAAQLRGLPRARCPPRPARRPRAGTSFARARQPVGGAHPAPRAHRPRGSWVAEVDGEMVGFATSFNRELMWILASYVVRPGLQGQGIGKALLAAAMHHGRGCLRGMLSASADPKAIRRYRAAGFSLHPQMHLTGTRRPVGDPGRGEGPRRVGRRLRADGLHRPAGPRRGARSRPRPVVDDVPARRLGHLDRQRLRLPRRRRDARPARGDQPAYGVPCSCGSALRPPATRCWSLT